MVISGGVANAFESTSGKEGTSIATKRMTRAAAVSGKRAVS
jgi:hypothetical protein